MKYTYSVQVLKGGRPFSGAKVHLTSTSVMGGVSSTAKSDGNGYVSILFSEPSCDAIVNGNRFKGMRPGGNNPVHL